MKAKHNKKRNTAFLYDVLVKELTKSIIDRNDVGRTGITNILKEYFSKESILGRELDCYRVLLETTGLELHVAAKLLHETKVVRSKLDGKKIFDNQTRVINKINSDLSKESWNIFVPNFKSLATISTIFNEDAPVKQRILYEDTVIKSMHENIPLLENTLEPIDNIVYQSFVKKYNEQYTSLLNEQKSLLGKYISSFKDEGLELKLYLHEEVGRLKTVVKGSLNLEEVSSDATMMEKTKEVLNILESYRDVNPSQEVVSTVLKIQQLVREIHSDD